MNNNLENPISLFKKMREDFVSYYDTQFYINNKKIMQERASLIDKEGVLWQYPQLEILKSYEPVGKDGHDSNNIIFKNSNIDPKFYDYINNSLFSNGENTFSMYKHQAESLNMFSKGKNIVLTTGTGSGKTEGMYLPILSILLNEAMGWEPTEATNNKWFLDKELEFDGTNNIFQRSGENRQSAVRCLMLFPLNALVEDQKTRLRKLFSGQMNLQLQKLINGNQIYFGSYTGKSPGSPNRYRFMDSERFDELKETIKNKYEAFNFTKNIPEIGDDLYMLDSFDGGEMWSRPDMQFNPPDILISNYSMLSAMLSRDYETNMLSLTKDWLSQKGNVFTLVVDELHSYRGTAGTEISYLLKRFLHKIGADEPGKLRIVASSASLSEESKNLLEDFFDVKSNTFHIISEPENNLVPTNINFQQIWNSKNQIDNLLKSNTAEEVILSAVNYIRQNTLDNETINLSLSRIAKTIFGDSENSINLLEVLLNNLDGPERFRIHYFLKSFTGIWCCIDSNCEELEEQYKSEDRLIGKLYHSQRKRCDCGAKVFELNYCFECGEIALSSNVLSEDDNEILLGSILDTSAENYSNKVYLFPVKNNIYEDLNEKFVGWRNRNQDSYVVAVSSRSVDNINLEFTLIPKNLSLNGELNKLKSESDKFNVFEFRLKPRKNEESSENWFNENVQDINPLPHYCPCCDMLEERDFLKNGPADLITKISKSVIKRMQPQVDSIIQSYGRVMVRDLTVNDLSSKKVVTFSDSVQGAAEFAHQFQQQHFINILRALVVKAFKEKEDIKFEESELLNYLTMTPEKFNNSGLDQKSKDYLSPYIKEIGNSGTFAYFLEAIQGNGIHSKVQSVLDSINDTSFISLNELQEIIKKYLLNLGINPTNDSYRYYNDYLKAAFEEPVNKNYHWSDVYKSFDEDFNWDKEFLERNDILDSWLSVQKSDFYARIIESISIQNDYEDLGIGILTYSNNSTKPKNKYGIENDIYELFIETTVRFLARHQRWSNEKNDLLPETMYERIKPLERFFSLHLEDIEHEPLEIFKEIHAWLIDEKICKKSYRLDEDIEVEINAGYLLNFDADDTESGNKLGIRMMLDDKLIKCRCKRKFLQKRIKFCFICNHKVDFENSVDRKDNYFFNIGINDKEIFRLNTEEMSSQSKDNNLIQRNFLGFFPPETERKLNSIPLENHIPIKLIDEIDILSVTTTMEAGVDIGSLKMVWLKNAPPQRFNYQQRVGRTGRRGQRFSYIIAAFKNTSHDNYYFDNTEQLVYGLVPEPFLNIGQERIQNRTILNDILNDLELENKMSTKHEALTPDVSGDFGDLNNWNFEVYSKLKEYLNNQFSQNYLLRGSTELNNCLIALNNWIEVINQEINLQEDKELDLARFMTDLGYLPLYGMPGSNRSLLLDISKKASDSNDVSRNKEIAISEYTPNAEIRRDKYLHRAIGIANFKGGKNPTLLNPIDNLNQQYQLIYCLDCGFVTEAEVENCEYCGAVLDDRLVKAKFLDPDVFIATGQPEVNRLNREYGTSSKSLYKFDEINEEVLIQSQKNTDGKYGFIKIYTINDNNRKGFIFRKIKKDYPARNRRNVYNGNPLVIADWEVFTKPSTHKFSWKKHPFYRNGWKSFNDDVIEQSYGFGVTKITNTLVLQINKKFDMNQFSINFLRNDNSDIANDLIFQSKLYENNFVSNSRKSAWLSAAEILKKHISQNIIQCESKDIDYEVAYHFDKNNIPVPTIFLTDTLPNGSGFTEQYFKNDWFDENLDSYIDKLENQNCCNESCYRCLRNYENRFIHNDLNLRLGIDLIKIFQGLNFDTEKIEKYEEFLCKTILKDFLDIGVEIEQLENVTFTNDKKANVFKFIKNNKSYYIYLLHPLESINFRYLEVRNQIEEFSDFNPLNFHTIDYLTALSSPSIIFKTLTENS